VPESGTFSIPGTDWPGFESATTTDLTLTSFTACRGSPTASVDGFVAYTYTPASAPTAPEPESLLLLGAGLIVVAGFAKRRWRPNLSIRPQTHPGRAVGLPHGEWQRNCPGANVFGNAVEDVQVKRLADVIAGEVFESGINDELVVARRP